MESSDPAAPAAASHEPPIGASSHSARLARSAGLIGIATMTSRVLGLVRDQVLAYLFGAGNAMDAFNVAFRIPNLARDLFAEGAMSAAFVPTFTRRLTLQGRDEAWRLGNQLVNALLLATGVLVVAGIVFAKPLIELLAPGYASEPGKLALTTTLTRIMLPFLTLVAVAVALMGMLNSLRRFFVPALSPAMFNVAMILSAVALVPIMPRFGLQPIVGMAFGALLGGLGQVAVQCPALSREGYRYRAVLDYRDAGLREMFRLMGPGTLGLAAVQINLLVNMILATGQGTGAVSWLSYAFRLMYLPIGLFGVSIATATLPDLARQAARQELAGMRETISSGLRMMLMLNVPATVGLITLASPTVALIFERGSFTSADTAATAAALVLLRARSARIRRSQDYRSQLLRPARQPHTGSRQHRLGAGEHRAEPLAGSRHWVSRLGSRNGHCRKSQRQRLAGVAGQAPGRAGRRAHRHGVRQDRHGVSDHGTGSNWDGTLALQDVARPRAVATAGSPPHHYRLGARRARAVRPGDADSRVGRPTPAADGSPHTLARRGIALRPFQRCSPRTQEADTSDRPRFIAVSASGKQIGTALGATSCAIHGLRGRTLRQHLDSCGTMEATQA